GGGGGPGRGVQVPGMRTGAGSVVRVPAVRGPGCGSARGAPQLGDAWHRGLEQRLDVGRCLLAVGEVRGRVAGEAGEQLCEIVCVERELRQPDIITLALDAAEQAGA
ncbi:MAG: hypothetical protein ACK559_13165, partial [bacterium]